METPTDSGRCQSGESSESTGDSNGRSRRQILKRSALTVSAVGIGVGAMGTASANGKGGQSAVPEADYIPENGAFYFDEFTGKRVKKTCSTGGNGIILAEWTFHYEGEDESAGRTIYTRDNAIDTTQRYAFSGKGTVDCDGFYLTPFSPAKDQ
ncbi:hypothetical protein VB773_15645 [Haloarculaceae archaeon H-GB2-1]|nr:hypothetical protein [Haloarculaceae archaeon H-GB1-1]MEA5387386.1 hypothetical protein [Haloarculaceae archaeon H-GB11]MEA5408858.1 hypothetical protein [Haloarculaceae archaeon H-GB2-1]